MKWYKFSSWKRLSGKYSFDYKDDFWIKTYGYELTSEQKCFLTMSNEIYNTLCTYGIIKLDDFYKYYKPYSKFEEPGCWTVKGAKHEYLRKHIKASIPFSIRELAKITYHYAIENSGATIYPMTGMPATTGYAVGGIANSMKVDRITEDIIYDFINRYLKHYIDFSSGGFYTDNGFFIGVWFDVKENKWYLEPSEIYFNKTAAQHKAKERSELAYYDLYENTDKNPDGTPYSEKKQY